MRLVAFSRSGDVGLGALVPEGVADLTAVSPSLGSDMHQLIEAWDAGVVARSLALAPVHPLHEVQLQAPLRPRRDVIAVGRNYREHAAEFTRSGFDASEQQEVPAAPIVFTKATTSVIGPDEAIVLANDPTGTTDYEGELGVVVGRRCRGVTREQALDHVFGWTIVNDVTARELQRRHVQWFIGKSPDTFCPIGPCITTRDELPDIGRSWVRTRVNGDERQHMPVSSLIFDVPSLIETLSSVMTLLPGDVIATGTGAGVGIGHEPPVFLASGDVVEVEIDGIGVLRNPVT